jgi:hypothetical protein
MALPPQSFDQAIATEIAAKLISKELFMPRTKRTSAELEKADLRLQSIKSISPTLDLGHGLTTVVFEDKIETAQNTLDEYNQLLAHLDEKSAALREVEKQIADLSERMLSAVGVKYGKDSLEYAQAGGVRKSDIKRPGRKPASKLRGPSSTV